MDINETEYPFCLTLLPSADRAIGMPIGLSSTLPPFLFSNLDKISWLTAVNVS